eukprot:UN03712
MSKSVQHWNKQLSYYSCWGGVLGLCCIHKTKFAESFVT